MHSRKLKGTISLGNSLEERESVCPYQLWNSLTPLSVFSNLTLETQGTQESGSWCTGLLSAARQAPAPKTGFLPSVCTAPKEL